MKQLAKKIAVLGFGYWGQKLAAVSKNLGLHVVITDTIAMANSEYEQQSWQDVLQDPEVKGVIIATPEKTHAEFVLAALQAHKAVLVEKPATTTVAAWKNCVQLAKKYQLPLMVDYTFLHSQALQYWQQLTQQYAAQLGSLKTLTTTRKTQLSQARMLGKALPIWWDVVIHDLYLLRAIFQASPTAWQVTSAQLPSQLTTTAKFGTTVLKTDYNWMAAPERSWQAEYDHGTVLWERVAAGEHFVANITGTVVVDEVIADQNPSPLDTLIQKWLESWESPASKKQQEHWQAVLDDVATLAELDKVFMAQIATR